VCVGPGIDDDEIGALGAGLVDPVDKPAFVITLKKLTLCATLVSQGPQTAIDILEGLMSVDIRLPGTQQVEVGPVKDQNMIRHSGFFVKTDRLFTLKSAICLSTTSITSGNRGILLFQEKTGRGPEFAEIERRSAPFSADA